MDRLNENLDLLVKLGRLFGPMQQLAESPDEYDEQERAETIARYFSEHNILIQDFAKFSTGQSGHNYQIEYKNFIRSLGQVATRIERGDDLGGIVAEQLAIARDAINAVPVPRSSIILDAGTPFTAYCKLRSLCEADATKSIVWFDPYFGVDIFHRYLHSCIEMSQLSSSRLNRVRELARKTLIAGICSWIFHACMLVKKESTNIAYCSQSPFMIDGSFLTGSGSMRWVVRPRMPHPMICLQYPALKLRRATFRR